MAWQNSCCSPTTSQLLVNCASENSFPKKFHWGCPIVISFLRRDVYWNIFSGVLQLKARVVQFQWVQNLPWPWKKVLPAGREGMCHSFIAKLVSTVRVILHSLSSGLQIILLLAFSRKLRCFSLITNSGLGVVRVPSCWVFINCLHRLLFAQSKEGIAWGEKHLLWLKFHIVWYEGFLA